MAVSIGYLQSKSSLASPAAALSELTDLSHNLSKYRGQDDKVLVLQRIVMVGRRGGGLVGVSVCERPLGVARSGLSLGIPISIVMEFHNISVCHPWEDPSEWRGCLSR